MALPLKDYRICADLMVRCLHNLADQLRNEG
jgi:hypothetical protein